MTRSKLYTVVFVTCILAYCWIGWNFYFANFNQQGFTLCIFKNITGLPCPSCGTTRAIVLLLNGDWGRSLEMNPLGVIECMALIILPFWIAFDVLKNRNTFQYIYLLVEQKLRKKYIAIPAVSILIAVWSWEIIHHT